MRIVYLNPCGNLGGAETSLRELLAGIRRTEPALELSLVLGEDGPIADIARDLGVTVMVKPFPQALARLGDAGRKPTVWQFIRAAYATGGYARSLAGLLRQIRPDLIHTNGFKMHLLGAWTRPRRTPLVWHIHDYVSSRRLMSHLLRVFQKACTVAIANSRSVAADLRALLPHLKVLPVYNAVDLERFSPTGTKVDLDAIAGLPAVSPETVRIGLVATFARWKGHRVFLQALAQVAATLPVRGYIIGGPIYQTDGSQWSQAELMEEVERLGLDGKVGFTGFLNDVPAALRSLDIAVHASTEPEPFGMVIIEAMACGRAVIASQAGGACELFSDGEDALGHPPGNAPALAQQMLILVGDEGLRRHLGKAGRVTAERSHSGERLARELLTVYREVAGSSFETKTVAAISDSMRTTGD